MVSGSRDIGISRVACGPGHGISIGSLGKGHEKEYVVGVRVANCSFTGTDNGVRIKTWAPSQSSLASNITFEDIFMRYARNPIVIDQQYCPHSSCMEGVSSAVQVENVMFKNIRGISQTKVAVNLLCSGTRPCKNIKLVNINLSYMNRRGQATAQCLNVFGASYGQQIPDGCL
ncbi:pectin lyase-like superfamily protein [Striga asiatica]|uniref:Pectin lyase-like superfamily protein n=1 Tax=Striga asiatica TaxID=4170 RepID=A0A5A7R558_STRAF|nr:pectin lyase-like superfamily protein [Striga asiatica]